MKETQCSVQQDELLQTIKELYEHVAKLKDGKSDREVEAKLEASLHELNVYQEELRTQSENLQQTLDEVEHLYKKYVNLFDFAPIGYFTFDRYSLIKEVNLTGSDLLGHERKHLINKPMIIFLHVKSRDVFQSHLRGVFSGLHSTVEVGLVQWDGTSIPVVLESAPIKDNHGNVVTCRTAAIDITERKQAEKALQEAHDELEKRVEERTSELRSSNKSLQQEIKRRKEAEAQLAAEKEILDITLHGVGDGIITTDIDGNVILMNEVAERLTGWSQKETAGKPIQKIFNILDETTRFKKNNPIDYVLATNELSELTNHTVLVEKEGTERIIEYTGLPIHDKNNEMIGAVLVISDVTEKRKIEEERSKANKLESLGFLAGGIAHDFNNLLTGIMGNISLAKLELDSPGKLDEILTEAEKACHRANYLTTQLLTFSKGGAPIKKAANIVDLIRESAKFVLRGSQVQSEFKFSDDIFSVEVDEGQMNQVMNNLLINALQAMPEGGRIEIRAENTKVIKKNGLPLKTGNYVKVSIKDHGAGIAKKDLDKIFDPYFSTKELGGQKGQGLGLATSYSIIKQHKGLITLDSQYGKGTTFHIYLPASTKQTRKNRIEPKVIQKYDGKILVMDDEEMLRKLSVAVLRKMGFKVMTASDGNEAIKLYKDANKNNDPFDAVIMDLTIPGGVGGKEAIKKLRDFDSKVKAVVSSGYSNDPVLSDHKKYGFNAVIAKPFQMEELSNVLQKLLNKSKEKR